MMKDKPEGFEETLADLIRAKFNYENANAALKKKFGEARGALDGSLYREMKSKLTGGNKVDEKLNDLGTKARKQVKPKKIQPEWTTGKQKAADNSQLARIINMGLYQGMMPMCANQELQEQDIQEVNPGGAVVATISFYFPEQKMDHPLVILGIRIVIMYVKFKSICSRAQKAVGDVTHVGAGKGLKPEMKTEVRK